MGPVGSAYFEEVVLLLFWDARGNEKALELVESEKEEEEEIWARLKLS